MIRSRLTSAFFKCRRLAFSPLIRKKGVQCSPSPVLGIKRFLISILDSRGTQEQANGSWFEYLLQGLLRSWKSIAYRGTEYCYWGFDHVNIAELRCHFPLTTMLLESECWQLSLTGKESYSSLLGLANFDNSRPVALNIDIVVFSRITGSVPMVYHPVTLGKSWIDDGSAA